MLHNRYGNVGPAAVKTQRPTTSVDEHRVLKFRPRTSAQPPGRPQPENARHEAGDLSRFERAREEPDDFRHRMLANLAAFAFTVALTAIGIWLALSIADLRKNQDCVLMGRRDCANISAIPRGGSALRGPDQPDSGQKAASQGPSKLH